MVHAGFVNTIQFSLVDAWLMGTAFLWVVSTECRRRWKLFGVITLPTS